MSNSQYEEYLTLAIEAADAGAALLKRYWGHLDCYENKSARGDLVTQADRESEEAILSLLKSRVPEHQIIAEESGEHSGDTTHLWAVDPLDGTTNYAHSYPFVAVSIALLIDQVPVVGVIYNPILGERYTAIRGGGAWKNGRPLSVSTTPSLDRALLATGFAYDRAKTTDNNYREFCHLTTRCHGVRRAGSAALDLAYVASGQLDGYWERGIKIWDIAAGSLLVEEAGGEATNYELGPLELFSGRVLATNGLIHQEVHNQLMEAQQFPPIQPR